MTDKQKRALELKAKLDSMEVCSNIPFGYFIPGHIKYHGEHYSYYTEEFVEFVKFIYDNLEEIINENPEETA
jgi:hypothetical protein